MFPQLHLETTLALLVPGVNKQVVLSACVCSCEVSILELYESKTKVSEDFTITMKAPKRAFPYKDLVE